MPFSTSSNEHTEEYWNNHFDNLLKPLIEENPEISAYRVNVLHEDILTQIITNLIISPIVVAELTDHNPNVFWELGVRAESSKLIAAFSFSEEPDANLSDFGAVVGDECVGCFCEVFWWPAFAWAVCSARDKYDNRAGGFGKLG